MALLELKNKLPHGLPGWIINSFIFLGHPGSDEWIREYRDACRGTSKSPLVTILSHARAFMVVSRRLRRAYKHRIGTACLNIRFNDTWIDVDLLADQQEIKALKASYAIPVPPRLAQSVSWSRMI